ncbi:hypothetical protein FACS1894187_21240 [Synergistales bacterium]|nr:hypothetical protein FACS1894187_21240 [Synergistales bacterium]
MKKSWSSWVLLFVAAVVLMAGGCGGGGGGDGDSGNNPGPIPGPAPGPGPNPEITNVALSNLTISNGVLAPVFSSGVTGYTASVGNNVSFITVKPTAASPDDVEITVNDAEVDSGLASEAIALNIGANIISVTVKAFDDPSNTRRYTVTVTRADAGPGPNTVNLNLSDLLLSDCTLTPAFASGTTSYTASVENSVSYIGVIPTAAAPQSVKIKIDDFPVSSGSWHIVPLDVGENPITITVSEAGNATNAKNYIVTVTRKTFESKNLDNDNDGILDVNEIDEAAIDTPVGMFTVVNGVRPSLNSIYNSTKAAEYAAAPGDRLELTGSSLAFADFSSAWIIIRNDDRTYLRNIRPEGKLEDGIFALLPMDIAGNSIEIFVVKNDKRTASISLKLISNQSPVLHSVSQIDANTLEVKGLNLNKATKLALNEERISLNAALDTIRVAIPSGLDSGYAWLINDDGDSNFVEFWISRKVGGEINLPGPTLDASKITVAQSLFKEVPIDSSLGFENLEVNAGDSGIVSVFYEYTIGKYALVAQAVVLENDVNTKITFESTALALMWTAIDIDSIAPEKLGQLRDEISADAKVQTLADCLKTELTADLTKLSDWTPNLKSAFLDAAANVAKIVEQKYFPQPANISSASIKTDYAGTITPDAKWALDLSGQNIVRFDEKNSKGIVIRNCSELQAIYAVYYAGNTDFLHPDIPFDMPNRIPARGKLYTSGWLGLPDISKGSGKATERQVNLRGRDSVVRIMTAGINFDKYDLKSMPGGPYFPLFRQLVADDFLHSAVDPLIDFFVGELFKAANNDPNLAEEVKLFAKELSTISKEYLDSLLTDETIDQWNKETVEKLLKNLLDSIVDSSAKIVAKAKYPKLNAVLKTLEPITKLVKLVRDAAWTTLYIVDSAANDSLIDFSVYFPGGNWINVADTSWYSPYKTEFTISTAGQLAGLAQIVNGDGALRDYFDGKTVTLTADIDLAGKEWTPIVGRGYDFKGTFDGGNHLISNLTINSESDDMQYFGLFGTNSGTLKNIRLAGSSITINNNSHIINRVGGLAGDNTGGTITNCTASGSITVSDDTNNCVGGLVGINFDTITNCTASGSITISESNYDYNENRYSVGGLVGSNVGTITNCTASGSVTVDNSNGNRNNSYYVGGLVGSNHNKGTITNCTASGRVTDIDNINHNFVGGFVGWNYNTAANSIAGNFYDKKGTGQARGIRRDDRHNGEPSNDGATPR